MPPTNPNTNANPTPPGAAPTPTPAAAHGTFVFDNGVEVPSQPTGTYRLNPGRHAPLATGSPFPVSDMLASSGSFLAVANGNSVTSYRVDAATGVPTAAGNAQVDASQEVAADAHNIYVAGTSADGANYVIYGFSIGGAGLLTPLPGSPFQLNSICDFCDTPTRMAINNSFVLVGTNGLPMMRAGFWCFRELPMAPWGRRSQVGPQHQAQCPFNPMATRPLGLMRRLAPLIPGRWTPQAIPPPALACRLAEYLALATW